MTEEQARKISSFEDTRVLIIGFGISGIVQTHTLLSNGFRNLTVVEAEDSFGGVWNLNKHYPGLSANNARHTFEFPELAQDPGSMDDFPTQEQLNAYLKQYIDKYNLEDYVHYGTRVQALERRYQKETDSWLFEVTFSKSVVAGECKAVFDFVICATGFTSKPYIPDAFCKAPSGVTVLHSSEIRKYMAKDANFMNGKRVAVIGLGKSGQDAASWAASTAAADAIDLIGPSMHWSAPQYHHPTDKVKGLTENEVIFSRLLSYIMPCNPAVFVRPRRSSLWSSLSHWILSFLQTNVIGKFIRDFVWSAKFAQFMQLGGVPDHLVPKSKFADESRHVCIQNPTFYPYIAKGRIHVILREPKGLDPTTGALMIQNDNGSKTSTNYDVVICGTGWDCSLDFLSEDIKSKLMNEQGQLQLFRNLYCPSLPQMGFLGYHQTINSILVFSVAARWITELAKCSQGSLVRRGVFEDCAYIQSVTNAGLEWDVHGARHPHGVFTSGMAVHHYVDTIVDDMGSTQFARRGPLLSPLVPSMYQGLMTEQL